MNPLSIKSTVIVGGILVSLLLATAAYAKITSLRLEAAEERLASVQNELKETRADRDRQVGAMSRQLDASQAMNEASANIMRSVRAAPPSASCAVSPRVGVYLDRLRQRPGANLPNGAAGRADAVPGRTSAPGRHL